MKILTWNDIENINTLSSVSLDKDFLNENSRTENETLNNSIIKNLELKEFFKNGSALTIGGFDGPHIGHIALLNSVLVHKKSLKTGVITFNHPPKSLQKKSDFLGDISTLNLKLQFFQDKGFDFVIVIDFSAEFSKMRGSDFLSILKDSCSMRFVATGTDFHCGYKADTGVAELTSFAAQNNIEVQIIDEVLLNGDRISSSRIRQCIVEGNFEEVNKLLGASYVVDLQGLFIRKLVSGLLEVSRNEMQQVLPPVGKYKICCFFNDTSVVSTIGYVESDSLRLEIPPDHDSNNLMKIEF